MKREALFFCMIASSVASAPTNDVVYRPGGGTELTSDTIKLARKTDATQGVFLSGGADYYVGAIGLNDPGASSADSGATLVGAYENAAGWTFTTVQEFIDDVIALIPAGSLDAIYLRLDTTNDPLTGNLAITPGVNVDGATITATGTGRGLVATSAVYGVKGTTSGGATSGVWGESSGAGVGVIGTSATGRGVYGVASTTGDGVRGLSVDGYGVHGRSDTSSAGYFTANDSTNTESTLVIQEAVGQAQHIMFDLKDSSGNSDIFYVESNGDTFVFGDFTANAGSQLGDSQTADSHGIWGLTLAEWDYVNSSTDAGFTIDVDGSGSDSSDGTPVGFKVSHVTSQTIDGSNTTIYGSDVEMTATGATDGSTLVVIGSRAVVTKSGTDVNASTIAVRGGDFSATGTTAGTQTVVGVRATASGGDTNIGLWADTGGLQVDDNADIDGTLTVDGATTLNANINAGNSVANDTMAVVALITQNGGVQLVPTEFTVTAASDSIGSQAANRNYLINVNNTSGGSVTITANPMISDGLSDRRILRLYNQSANSVVFTTEATDPGSNLILQAATRTLAQYDTLELIWDSTASAWVETNYSG